MVLYQLPVFQKNLRPDTENQRFQLLDPNWQKNASFLSTLFYLILFCCSLFAKKRVKKCPICVQDEFFQKVIHTNLMYLMYFNCNNPQNFTKNSSKWILTARVAEILTKIGVKMTNCTQCKSVSVTGPNQYYILMCVIYSNNLKNFKII